MTILRVTLLGTSAAQPTLRRGLSATAVRAHGDRFLVDCGEGTQRQMLRFGTGFGLDFVLFTHFHADHYLGILGFTRTLGMHGREQPLDVFGPAPFIETLARWIRGDGGLPYEVRGAALADGATVERDGYRIRAVAVDHRGPALGYVIEEPPRPGVFDVDRARQLGIPPGPAYGRLQAGESIEVGGRTLRPEDVLGPARRGRKVAFSGDTRPCEAFIAASAGADVIVHDSTFGDAEQERACETHHSTAFEAATVAAQAAAGKLVLTHFSTRYDTCPDVLKKQAARAFHGEIAVAEDGYAFEVPFR
jgi:ribonuclease Z